MASPKAAWKLTLTLLLDLGIWMVPLFCCPSLGINESTMGKLHSNCYCTTGHWWDFFGFKKIWMNKYIATSNLTQSFFRSLPNAVFTKVEDGYLFPPHTKVLEDLFDVGPVIQCSFDVPHMPFRFFSPWVRSFELGLLPMYGRRWSNYSCSYIATLIFLINFRKSWHQCAGLQDKRSFLYQYPAYSIFLTRLAWVVECDLDCTHRPYSGGMRIVKTRHRTLWFAKHFWKCGMMDQLLYCIWDCIPRQLVGRYSNQWFEHAKTLRCRLSPHTSRGVWPARIKQEWACLPGLVERQPEQTNQSLVGSKGVWFRGDCDALECPKWSEFNNVYLFSALHVGFKPKKRNETYICSPRYRRLNSTILFNCAKLTKIHFSNIHLLKVIFQVCPPNPPTFPNRTM